MEAVQADAPVIATPDPDLQHDLIRENVPDPLAGEQTWPTEEVGTIMDEQACWRARCIHAG